MSKTKQTIAIIGAGGKMGSMIAERISGNDNRLLLCDDHPAISKNVQKALTLDNPAADIEIIDCKHEACWEADIIVLAISFEKLKEVAKMIRDVATQKIIISISDPLNTTLNEQSSVAHNNALNELQTLFPHSKIVRVFRKQDPVEGENSGNVFVTGNEQSSTQEVKDLLKNAGLNPVITEISEH